MKKVYIVLSLTELKNMVQELEKSSVKLYGSVQGQHTLSLHSELTEQKDEFGTQVSSARCQMQTLLGKKYLI